MLAPCSIIAIHGLDGHRFRSFTAFNGVNWLRDLLPQRFPQSRILSFGYDSRHSAMYANIQDYATTLISKLVLLRRISKV